MTPFLQVYALQSSKFNLISLQTLHFLDFAITNFPPTIFLTKNN